MAKDIGRVWPIKGECYTNLGFFTNAFLSPLVCIQERQKVITGGAYRFVRHPMYLGLFAMFLSDAVLCGSVCGAAASLLTLAVLGIQVQLGKKC